MPMHTHAMFMHTKMLPWFIKQWIFFRKDLPKPKLYMFEQMASSSNEALNEKISRDEGEV